MMKKIYTLGLVSLSLFLGASCSKSTDTEPSNSQTSEQKLPEYTASINLSATFSSGAESMRAYLTPTADGEIAITFKDEELMKDGTSVDASGNPIRVLGSETGKLTFFFVKKSDLTTVISADPVSPTDFRKVGDKYVISYHGTVTASGLDLSSGEWYVSGGYRLDAEGNKTGNIAGSIYLDAEGKIHRATGDLTDFKIPFVFGWTKLATKQDDASFANNHGQSLNLNMIPDGYMLRIHAINNLVEDINLSFLGMIRENMGASGGNTTVYQYSASVPKSEADLVTSATPRITGVTGTSSTTLGLGGDKTTAPTQDAGTGLVLASGDYYPWYQRFNSPTNLSNVPEGSGLQFYFRTVERKLGTDVTGADLESREIEGLTGTPQYKWPQTGPILTDDWRGGTMYEYVNNYYDIYGGRGFRSKVLPMGTTFKQGKVNNINFKITSELMITELYTTRYSHRSGSYGLIEIYNPTLDEIDLSKYALLRIGYRNVSGANKIRVVPTATEYDQSQANPGDNIVANISSALVLPLDLTNGNPTGNWAINSYAYTLSTPKLSYRYTSLVQNEAIVSNPVTYGNFASNVVDFSKTGYISNLEPITAGGTKLKPGKTIIILFSGFASPSYQPTEEDRAIFSRIQAAAKAGYCQSVVAISQGSAVAPHEAGAGVTTADLGDSFSLVKVANLPTDLKTGQRFNPSKYRTRDERRIFVDGTWAPVDFDKGNVVATLMANSAVNAILRRPYGPYLWNKGFLPPSDMSSYYQVAYTGASQATFGAPYFSSYEAGKNWSSVVAPKVERRNAALFKSK